MKNAAIALLLWSVTCGAQSDADAVLEPGRSIAGTLAQGESTEHLVDLEPGFFVYGEAEQVNFNVRVTVRDPSGNVVDSFDGPHRGPESIQFETTRGGRYSIRVEGVDEQSGSYRITLLRVEPIAAVPEERLDQLLSAYAGESTPGAIIAVIRDGKVVHQQAVGMANMTFGIPFSRDTVSNIGSVSKQFTAFAVTRLAADGLLSLDDDVRDYFPELPDLGHVVTIRQILDHTSGYREFLNLLFMAGVRLDKGDYIDRDEVLEILERQPKLQDEPGSRFNYNNTAYSLAALLVERVTETPFQEWMQKNVFAPLGMDHTRIRSHTGEIVPNAAEGYVFAEESPYRIAVDLGGGGGATMGPGGVYTTVDDLAKWVGNLGSGAIGGANVVREIMTPQVEVPGANTHYGLGLVIDEQRGLARVRHNGGDTAHRAGFLYFPDIDAGVVAMSNNGSFDLSIPGKVAEVFFAEDMEPEAEPTPAPEDTAVTAIVDIAAFERFAGQYELDAYPGDVIIVSLNNDNVYVQTPGGDKRPVSPLGPTSLSLGPDRRIEFDVDDGGEVTSLKILGDNELVATKLDDWTPEPAELSEFAGRYFSEELDAIYMIEQVDDRLILRHRRHDDIELTPKVIDTFNGSDVVDEVRFVRNDNRQLTGFMASNTRTLDVWFERQD